MSVYLLSILVWFPFLVAIILMFVPRQAVGLVRWISVGAMVVELLVSLRMVVALHAPDGTLFAAVDYSKAGYLFVESHTWIESFGIGYKLGIDGLSVWLVLLTTALSPIALFGSWTGISTKIKEYAIAFLLLESAMLGAFVALDLFLFYVFWELMLVPMYLIIGVWGGPERVYASVKFFLYTLVGSVLMLVAILYVVAQYKALSGHWSFDLEEISRLVLPAWPQYLLFSAFAFAFAIKVPMFPLHTWLPDAHVQAPTGGSVILAAVLLKMGTYGFLRFAMPLFPLASYKIVPTLGVLAVIGIVYGAYCAWKQKDVKKLVAYSSVSHLGFVMLGLFSMTPHGISGAILQMVNHGISTGALFVLVGVIYERRHTRDIEAFGGLAKAMPIYATLFIIIAMSSVGLPGTNGFVGEFMILAGTFTSTSLPVPRIFAMVASTGVILAAIYMLHAVLKLFWGPVTKPENKHIADVGWREAVVLVPLVVLVFWIGLYPKPFLSRMDASVAQFVSAFDAKFGASVRASEPMLLPGAHPAAPEGDAAPAEPDQGATADAAGPGVRIVAPPRALGAGGAP